MRDFSFMHPFDSYSSICYDGEKFDIIQLVFHFFAHAFMIVSENMLISNFSSLIFYYLIILKQIFHIWLCGNGQILFCLIKLPTASLLKNMVLVVVFFFKIAYVVLNVCCMLCNVS